WNMAFVGISGRIAKGPRNDVWADDPDKDAQGLAEIDDRLTVKKGHVITMGFSQGGQVGLEIAVRNPQLYAGSIAMSPGANDHLDRAGVSPLFAAAGIRRHLQCQRASGQRRAD